MKQITIVKVAEAAGVSKTTVSKYLNGGNVLPEYMKRIEDALKKLNYRPNFIAKALKTDRTYTVGILIPFIDDLFSTQIVANMEKIFQENGYGIFICGYEGDKKLFRLKLDFLLGKMVDAVAVFPSGLSAEDFDEARKSGVPVCLVDREIEGVEADVVMTDNEQAGYTAMKYLLDRGHKDIAVITGYDASYTSKRRNGGIMRAIQESDADMSRIVFSHCYNSDDIFGRVQEIMAAPVLPEAIFSTNFYLTYKTIKALNRLGKRIPEDVSIRGRARIPRSAYPFETYAVRR